MNTDLILQNTARIIDLDPEEIEFFTSLLAQETIKRRQHLLQNGRIARYIFFVNTGCLRVYNIDDHGKVHTPYFAVEEHWVSDLYSFLTETPATFNIDALEDTEILCISKPDTERLYQKVPKFERFFRIMHQRAFLSLHERLMDHLSTKAEEKYQKFQQRYPGLELRIPQKHIAAYLGITPEFLSMLRRERINRNS